MDREADLALRGAFFGGVESTAGGGIGISIEICVGGVRVGGVERRREVRMQIHRRRVIENFFARARRVEDAAYTWAEDRALIIGGGGGG